jgi:hypothetical protein
MADAAYRTAEVDGLTLFYREAGAADATWGFIRRSTSTSVRAGRLC